MIIPSILTEQAHIESAGGMITSIASSEELQNILLNMPSGKGQRYRTLRLLGMVSVNGEIKANIPSKDRSNYSQKKYKFFLDAPFEISNKCCDVMKKEPAHNYKRQTGRVAITAQMACESKLRLQQWLNNGCNAFDNKYPISNPMSFWLENDVLQYIVENDLEICSAYGDIVRDYDKDIDGQMDFADFGIGERECKYKTTGCSRTGCVCCAYGAHLEKKENSRFLRLKETHPSMYGILDVAKNNGYTYREAIEWVNNNSNGKVKIWI